MLLDIYEVIEDDEVSYAAIPRERSEQERKAITGDGEVKLLKTIEGISWESCMTEYYKFMGWEEYKTMD